MLDIEKIRKDFPILSREIYGRPLVYLDNGATTQKPLCVLDAMRDEYLNVNANVHRGVHWLSQQATDLHEAARETVRKFVNARSTSEIVFTRGTTESLNLVASSFVEGCMEEGDEVIVSTMEHHSNIVPWQLQQQRKNIRLRVIPMSDDGALLLDEYEKLFSKKTKLVSVMHVSNVLGTVNPVKEIIRIAHSHGVPVMIDGAQSIPHMRVDVQDLDCEFLAFSGHKVYAPTGVGVLYGKEEWLDRLPPYQGGGEMIERVSFDHTTFERPPLKFEAGTTSPPTDLPRRSTTSQPLAWRTFRRMSTISPTTPCSSFVRSRECTSMATAKTWRLTPSSPSTSPTSTMPTSARSSTNWALPCAQATIAPNPSWTVSAYSAPCARRSPSTTRERRSIRS